MEKLKNLAIVSRLKALMRSGGGQKSMSVYLAWRLTLISALCVAAAVAAFAWISYGWAVKEAELQFSRPNRETFSIDELRSVIEMYQKREEEHASLRQARPPAPTLGVGAAN